MTGSIYQQLLGERFELLQPQLQNYFSLAAGTGTYGAGSGIFDVVGCPLPWLRPALAVVAGENAFFPEYGVRIPFQISNYAHLDPYGRPSLTARRQIDFVRRSRVFEDTTSLNGGAAVDYVGRSRRILTDLHMQVTDEGRLRMISTGTRFALPHALLGLPAMLDTRAYMEQWWDADARQFRIQTRVIAPLLGTIFLYAGGFDYELRPIAEGLPERAHPARWERRV